MSEATIELKVNGRTMSVPAGTSVAAAVALAGVAGFRPLCGMGICFECRVTIDGAAHRKSCETPCRPGMEVVGRTPWSAAGPLAGFSPCSQRPTRASAADQGVRPTRRFDILIIGAGPAGIAAACAASEGGGSVGVVDGSPGAGGQIWRAETSPWLKRFHAAPVEFLPHTQVLDAPAPGKLLACSGGEAIELSFSSLILATGARELFLPFPGWTLPNVMGAGGLQALVKGGWPVAGKRVIVAGTGPLLLAVAQYLRKRGATIPLIAEQAPWRRLARFGRALLRQPSKLAQAVALGVASPRYLTGCWPVHADGAAVTLRRADQTWSERCDYLACGFGLTPNLELASLLRCKIEAGFVSVDEWQRTSVENVYCAGEPAGIGGVDLALAGGEIAGYAAAGLSEKAVDRFGVRDRALLFRRELARAFALRDELKSLPAPDTIVCRCEDVAFDRLTEYRSSRSAKLQTRCGMGPCQGRICGPAAEFLLGWPPASVRPPIFPAPVDLLVGKPVKSNRA